MVNRYDIVQVNFTRLSEKMKMGRLLFKERKIYFEYAPEFLATKLELSPYKLPLKPGIFVCPDPVFDGLFGVFDDSLPDGWGRLLLDRKLIKAGKHPSELTPLDRLCYVGSHGMGALTYEPEIVDNTAISHHHIDDIANECLQFQANNDDQFVDELFVMNGSSAGARPKILINLFENGFKPSSNDLSTNHNDWIIKFSSSYDLPDSGSIEYAYHLMAKAAGLDVPEARLFPSKKTPGYFGVKRFDRMNNYRYHIHTVGGLLHLSHRVPSFDYEDLLKATLWLTKDIRESEKQFRHAVFNVLAYNRDDHVKNFSFLMDVTGEWRVSPAYDLTFSTGPYGEHSTTTMGEGKQPGLNQLLKLAATTGIERRLADAIIDQVRAAIANWNTFATTATVTKKSRELIWSKLKN